MRRTVRWIAIAWFILAGLVGAASATPSERPLESDSQRLDLEARLDRARSLLRLEDAEVPERSGRLPDERIAQWFNWPNWSNWSNWSNWGNWGNW